MSEFELLVFYIIGQIMVACTVPLLSYWLARPHLQTVARKAEEVAVAVEEVRIQTNGQSAKLEEFARRSGFAAGVAEEHANPT